MNVPPYFFGPYVPEVDWRAGPVSPAILATHGPGGAAGLHAPEGSVIRHTNDLGYFVRFEKFTFSEKKGFLINGVPFGTLEDCASPAQPTDGYFLACRSNDATRDAYFWQAQLEHRGLPTTGSIEVAKVRLLLGENNATVKDTTHVDIMKEQLGRELAHILQDSRRGHLYKSPVPLSIQPQRLFEEPSPTEADKVTAKVDNRIKELLLASEDYEDGQPSDDDSDITVQPSIRSVKPDTFEGRFELVAAPSTTSTTATPSPRSKFKPPATAGEIIFVLDAPANTLYGRFRVSTGPKATHGFCTVSAPRLLSTSEQPCDVAIERPDGSQFNITHPGRQNAAGTSNYHGAWIKYLAPDLIVLGPAFRGAAGGVSYAVKQASANKGFSSKSMARLEGMESPALLRGMWKSVHDADCDVQGCQGVVQDSNADQGWDRAIIASMQN